MAGGWVRPLPTAPASRLRKARSVGQLDVLQRHERWLPLPASGVPRGSTSFWRGGDFLCEVDVHRAPYDAAAASDAELVVPAAEPVREPLPVPAEGMERAGSPCRYEKPGSEHKSLAAKDL